MLASSSKKLNITAWVLQVLVAGGFVMAAVPKLTGDPMSVELFERIGGPSFSIYAVGALEIVAAALILIPKTRVFGAALAILTMLGAIGSHVATPLGLFPEFVDAESGETFAAPLIFMAVAYLALSAFVVFLRRDELPIGAGASEPAKEAVVSG